MVSPHSKRKKRTIAGQGHPLWDIENVDANGLEAIFQEAVYDDGTLGVESQGLILINNWNLKCEIVQNSVKYI